VRVAPVDPRVLIIVPRTTYRFVDFPLGVNYLKASVVRRCKGASCEVVDLNGGNELDEVLTDLQPDIIGVTATMPLTGEAMRVARVCRSLLGEALLVAGGPQPTIWPHVFLDDFDLVVRGEGEIAFAEIVNCWPGRDYHHIDAVCGDLNGRMWISERIARLEHLDRLAFPSRSAATEYGEYVFKGKALAPVVTSRGCPFECIFCAKEVSGGNIRYRATENVVAELLSIRAETGISCFQFRDDTFTLDRLRAMRLASEIMEADSSVSWLCNTRADALDRELVRHLAACGCKRISMGVEAASDALLELLRKGQSVKELRAATEWCHENGVSVKHYYMVGIPSQTLKDAEDTARFIRVTRPDEIYCSVFMPYPGSAAWSLADELGIRFLFDVGDPGSWQDAHYQSNTNYREAPPPIETDSMSAAEIVQARELIWDAFLECRRDGASDSLVRGRV